jgi:hypothetical protein
MNDVEEKRCESGAYQLCAAVLGPHRPGSAFRWLRARAG